MKTRILHGLTILGAGALLFGISAMTPAHADDWHGDRDHPRAVLDLRLDRGHVNFQIRGDHDRDYYERYDRDRDRDRWHEDRYDRDRDHDRRR